ncbi:hypothetical protein [Streptomyces hydrogenans]|uniref:hypothetical protein n=1 Tax=Streptomyces hydrogenans TaxID=1873719 RepID=UPI0035DBE339
MAAGIFLTESEAAVAPDVPEPVPHWHAYWWAGEEMPVTAERDDPVIPAPPKLPGEWFRKPHSLHRGAYPNASSALEWLAGRILFEEPHPHAPFAVSGLIESAEKRLTGRQDVTWQFRSRRNRIVMAAMLTCPRPGYRCPQDTFTPEPPTLRASRLLP